MGYCSNVALCLSPKGEAQLQEALSSQNPEVRDFVEQYADQAFQCDGASLRIWYAQKWDADFNDCATFVDEFVSQLSFTDFRFYKIGEYLDDIEDSGGYFDNPFRFHVVRSFAIESS
jgi:hypothetical protein